MAENEEIYSSNIFTFLVGKKSFYAHKALISKHSKPLDRLMNADMKEKERMAATLVDIEPATFARFLEWAYKGYYTPAPHTMDELPAAISEVNGIKKEQKEFAGMFSTEPLFTNSRHDEIDRLTPRAASLLQSAPPTPGNPAAPSPLPSFQPVATAPLAPPATAPTTGLFGSTPAPPGNTTTTGGAGPRPASANSAPRATPSLFSGSGAFAPWRAPASTTSTSSSTTATPTTSQNTVLDTPLPAPTHPSIAATGTNNPAVPSTRPASASTVPNPTPNTTGAGGFGSAAALFGSRPAPTSSTSASGATTTTAPAVNTSTGSLFDRLSTAGGSGSASAFASNTGTGLFGSNPAPSSNTNIFANPAPSSSTSIFANPATSSTTNSSNIFANPAPSSTTNTSSIFANPPQSSTTNSSSIFASRANPAFGGFGAPPTAPSALTQPTGLFGGRPSLSGATANRQTSPSPFGGKESTLGFGSTTSTQRPLFVSAKDQLKEAFISRQPKVLRSVIEIPPTRGNWLRENHTDVLLSHAQLYVFADEQDIQPLKTLALESLHAALSLFFLYPGRTKDIVTLLRYSYDNTADLEGHRDELRELLTEYMGLEMEILVKDKGLRDVMTKDDDGIGQEERAALLGDFMAVVAKRL